MKTIHTLLIAAAMLLPCAAAGPTPESQKNISPSRKKKEKPKLTQEQFNAVIPLLVQASQEVAEAMEKIQDEATAKQFEGELRDAMLRLYFLQGSLYQFDHSEIKQDAIPAELAQQKLAADASISTSAQRISEAEYYGSKIIKAMFWH